MTSAMNDGIVCEQTICWNLAHPKYFQVCFEYAQCFQIPTFRYLKAEPPVVKKPRPLSRESNAFVALANLRYINALNNNNNNNNNALTITPLWIMKRFSTQFSQIFVHQCNAAVVKRWGIKLFLHLSSSCSVALYEFMNTASNVVCVPKDVGRASPACWNSLKLNAAHSDRSNESNRCALILEHRTGLFLFSVRQSTFARRYECPGVYRPNYYTILWVTMARRDQTSW